MYPKRGLHTAGAEEALLDEEVLFEGDAQFGFAADGGGEFDEVIDVAFIGTDGDLLFAGLIGSGGLGEVDGNGGRLDGVDDNGTVGAVDFEGAVAAGVGLEVGTVDDGHGVGELKDSGGVVVEGVVELTVFIEERGDAFGAAEEADDGVNHVSTELEHIAAFELGPFGAAVGGEDVADAGADEIDIAEPAFAGGFEGKVDAGVVAPHVADLEKAVLAAGEVDDFLEVAEVISGGLFQVEVFAGGEGGEAVAGVVPDERFDGDNLDAGVVENLVPG